MIWKEIDFHNVEELESTPKGMKMWRVPKSLRMCLSERAKNVAAAYSTGVELRFRLKGDQAVICLASEEMAEAQTAFIYYGNFQGGWEYSSKTIGPGKTFLTVKKPSDPGRLKEMAARRGDGFSPELVRVVLPYGICYFLGIEGEVEPPHPEDLPKKTYLAYGSSITHGSLALGTPYTYPFAVSQKLACDYLNLGFAGCARMEKEFAEYLVSRKDWDFASVEIGINMLDMPLDVFEKTVSEFVSVMEKDGRPVFAVSIFRTMHKDQEKMDCMREIVAKTAKGRLIFKDGLEIMPEPSFVSADLTHPDLWGMRLIAENMGNWMGDVLKSYCSRGEQQRKKNI